MKLKLKHLAPYLPYRLKGAYKEADGLEIWELDVSAYEIDYDDRKLPLYHFWQKDYGRGQIKHIKLILHQLSDLTKEVEVNGEKFVPLDYLYSMKSNKLNWDDKYHVAKVIKALNKNITEKSLPYFFMEKLFEWHFDVFGLIKNGLAIDINTLNK